MAEMGGPMMEEMKDKTRSNLINAMTLQLCLFLCFSSYFWGWGKAGEPKEDGSLTLAEARTIMNDYNSELVSWIDFAIYCFLVYTILNFLFILVL